jgi:hypothetical protein
LPYNQAINASTNTAQVDVSTTTTGSFVIPAVGATVVVAVTNGTPILNGTPITQILGGGHTMQCYVKSGGTTNSLTVVCTSADTIGATMPSGAYVSAQTGAAVSRGNSAWPDSSTNGLNTITGSTAAQLITSALIAGFSMGTLGGFKAKMVGQFALSGGGTGQLIASYGGNTVITIGGTWLVGDTATFTLNGHGTTYTAGAAPTPASVAVGVAAAINADATSNLLCIAVADSYQKPGGTPKGTVQIIAKPAVYALAATVAQATSLVSAGGTISTGAGFNPASFVVNLLNYTSSANVTSPYRIEISAVNLLSSLYFPYVHVSLYVGTTLTTETNANIQIDTTIDQTLNLYGTLSVSGNDIVYNTLQYERV